MLEMGSNSLKLYLVDQPGASSPEIETVKFPWNVAHDFFSTGALSPGTVDEIVARIAEAELLADGVEFTGVLSVATGVFREVARLDALIERVKAETGVRIRVISGADEAMLMARGFRDLHIDAPAVLCDLGGATLEWVFMDESGSARSGSERLGAIRNEYAFAALKGSPDEYLERSAAYCDEILAQLPWTGTPVVVAAGGTALALTEIAASLVVSTEQLREIIAGVMRDGPPEGIKPSRQAVLLPGLVILWRVAERCSASQLTYGTAAVRHGMVCRLLQLLQRHAANELHATQLLRTTQKKL